MKKTGIISALILMMAFTTWGQKYIQVERDGVNIRFSPSTSSEIIAQAKKGDIFKLIEKKENWYEMTMFTGEYRYIHKNLCKEVKFEKDLSNLPHPSIDIFFAFVRAEDQALRDADQKLPPAKNVYKNIEINRACIFRSNPDTYSGLMRTAIPFHCGQSFRFNPDTRSVLLRTPIPEYSGQLFRFIPDTFLVNFRPLIKNIKNGQTTNRYEKSTRVITTSLRTRHHQCQRTSKTGGYGEKYCQRLLSWI